MLPWRPAVRAGSRHVPPPPCAAFAPLCPGAVFFRAADRAVQCQMRARSRWAGWLARRPPGPAADRSQSRVEVGLWRRILPRSHRRRLCAPLFSSARGCCCAASSRPSAGRRRRAMPALVSSARVNATSEAKPDISRNGRIITGRSCVIVYCRVFTHMARRGGRNANCAPNACYVELRTSGSPRQEPIAAHTESAVS